MSRCHLRYVTAMKSLLVFLVALVACGGGSMTNVQLVNTTPRIIESVFVNAPGQPHGAPAASKIAPNETRTMKLKLGNYEVYAVSEKIVHEDNTRETPEASITIELRDGLTVVFYDSNASPPPGIEARNKRGVVFTIKPAPAAPAEGADEPSIEPIAPTE